MRDVLYIKVVLTVVAACLVWICLRDIKLLVSVHAQPSFQIPGQTTSPLPVTIVNWPNLMPVVISNPGPISVGIQSIERGKRYDQKDLPWEPIQVRQQQE